MIEPVLREINNYYFYTSPLKATGIENNVILCDVGKVEVGQYVYINNHPKYTGVYKIAGIFENGIKIDYPMIPLDDESLEMVEIANTTLKFDVYPLAIPQGVIELAQAIQHFESKNPLAVTSESLGDYSVSYSSSDGVASWQSAYSKQLASYRKVYLELPSRWR